MAKEDAEPNQNDENIRAEGPSQEEDAEPDFEPEDDSDNFSVHSDLKDIMLSPDEISAPEDDNLNDVLLTSRNVSYTNPSIHDLLVRELAEEKETEFYVLAAGIAGDDSFESILEEDRICRELLAEERANAEKGDCVTSYRIDCGHGGDDNCSIAGGDKAFKKLGDGNKVVTQETQALNVNRTPEPNISNAFENNMSETHSRRCPEHNHASINNLQLLEVVITELGGLANDLSSIKASSANKCACDSDDQIIHDWVLVERAMSPPNGENLIHPDCQLSTTPKGDGLQQYSIDHIDAEDDSILHAELTMNGEETAYSLWYGNLLYIREEEFSSRRSFDS